MTPISPLITLSNTNVNDTGCLIIEDDDAKAETLDTSQDTTTSQSPQEDETVNVFVSFLRHLFASHTDNNNNNDRILNVLKMLSVNISMWFCQNITMKSLLLNDKYKTISTNKNINLELDAINNETLISAFDLLSQYSLFCTFSLKYKMTRFGYFEILSSKESLYVTHNNEALVAPQTLLNKLSHFYPLFYVLICGLNSHKYIFNSINCNGETFLHESVKFERFLNVCVYVKDILGFDVNRIFLHNIGNAYDIATIITHDALGNKNTLKKFGNVY